MKLNNTTAKRAGNARRITVADVARSANVDPSTVSRILNGRSKTHRYNQKIVDHVTAVAQKLGYRSFPAARTLRTGKAMLIGFLVTEITNSFFSELTAYVERQVSRYGCRLLICNTFADVKLQREHITDLVAGGIDGLMLVACGVEGCRRGPNLRGAYAAADVAGS